MKKKRQPLFKNYLSFTVLKWHTILQFLFSNKTFASRLIILCLIQFLGYVLNKVCFNILFSDYTDEIKTDYQKCHSSVSVIQVYLVWTSVLHKIWCAEVTSIYAYLLAPQNMDSENFPERCFGLFRNKSKIRQAMSVKLIFFLQQYSTSFPSHPVTHNQIFTPDKINGVNDLYVQVKTVTRSCNAVTVDSSCTRKFKLSVH